MVTKQITLSLGFPTSTTSKDEVKAILKADGLISHHPKAVKPFIPTIVNLTNGEWGIRMSITKDELVQIMAKLMAGQAGPSTNMDEVAEMANEVWEGYTH